MIRKYHNHKPQTTQWHREEEPLNHHETSGIQIKQSNQLSLPHQDECNTTMDVTYNKTEQLQSPTMGVTINKSQQQQNHRLRTDSSLSHRGGGGGGLNAFYWYQIFALDSAVVEVQEMFSSHGSLLTNVMYHHGETL